MTQVRPQSCTRCGGGAYLDAGEDEWRCLLCARPVLVSEIGEGSRLAASLQAA